VTEEEIDQTIDGLRERHATFSDVTGRTLELREGWLKLTEKDKQ
jgi:FKBP-type peptidyl-prolyl cis-trans isomerase (trigger factor)